jgi:hypothetical protein
VAHFGEEWPGNWCGGLDEFVIIFLGCLLGAIGPFFFGCVCISAKPLLPSVWIMSSIETEMWDAIFGR